MFYSQEMYNEGITNICDQILASDQQYQYIIAICRGGLIPATSISYRLNIPIVPITVQTRDRTLYDIGDTVYMANRYNCLVVDDIVDTGHTVEILLEKWNKRGIDMACLIYNEGQQQVKPTYYHKLINKNVDPAWVTFWWD